MKKQDYLGVVYDLWERVQGDDSAQNRGLFLQELRARHESTQKHNERLSARIAELEREVEVLKDAQTEKVRVEHVGLPTPQFNIDAYLDRPSRWRR